MHQTQKLIKYTHYKKQTNNMDIGEKAGRPKRPESSLLLIPKILISKNNTHCNYKIRLQPTKRKMKAFVQKHHLTEILVKCNNHSHPRIPTHPPPQTTNKHPPTCTHTHTF